MISVFNSHLAVKSVTNTTKYSWTHSKKQSEYDLHNPVQIIINAWSSFLIPTWLSKSDLLTLSVFSSVKLSLPEASDSLYNSLVLSAASNSSSVSFSWSRYLSNSSYSKEEGRGVIVKIGTAAISVIPVHHSQWISHCLCVALSARLFVCLFVSISLIPVHLSQWISHFLCVSPSVYLSVCLFLSPSFLSIFLSEFVTVSVYFCLSICLSVCLYLLHSHPSFSVNFSLSLCISVCLFLSVCLSICLYVCLYLSSPLFLFPFIHSLPTPNLGAYKDRTL